MKAAIFLTICVHYYYCPSNDRLPFTVFQAGSKHLSLEFQTVVLRFRNFGPLLALKFRRFRSIFPSCVGAGKHTVLVMLWIEFESCLWSHSSSFPSDVKVFNGNTLNKVFPGQEHK